MNRKEFIESLGATCRNWRWSWSFVNEDERFVVFGAWDVETEGSSSRILSDDWEKSRAGRRQPAYSESREHVRLVEEEGYQLFTFPMQYSDAMEGESGRGPAAMAGFTPELFERTLTHVGGQWYASNDTATSRLPEEVPDPRRFTEGAAVPVTINAYERSTKARKACLEHHGYDCVVCGFDFEEAYGEIGRYYIHVHHVVPLASVGAEYIVDPLKDLVPVCPNCHAMIHRTEPTLTVEQLRVHLDARAT